MIITISEAYKGTKLHLGSKNPKFEEFVSKEYSKGSPMLDPKDGIYCAKENLFYWMSKASDYANNTLNEECIFDAE